MDSKDRDGIKPSNERLGQLHDDCAEEQLLEALFANYDKLDEDPRSELPLKRIWTVAAPDDE